MKTTFFTVNAGSSSIKFSVYTNDEKLELRARGQVENLGPTARLIIKETGHEKRSLELGAADHMTALKAILIHAEDLLDDHPIAGVGHRIAHGGIDFVKPTVLDEGAMAKLKVLEPLAPLHQPHNLKMVEAAKAAFPDAVQVGCFDTAFHRTHPFVNDTFGLPRRYYEKGVRRYGFHGLSYDYITSEIERTEPQLQDGRIVIAHLGNGASMCAVNDGKSRASTMGFSALDGLPMGTRCGQIDPGVLLYMLDNEKLTSAEISRILYKESGLKGLSGMTNDMRILQESDAPAAKEALDYYAFRARREMGAMAAVLGGLDGIVFCGGIGENSAMMRKMILQDMDWLGIEIDDHANEANAREISTGKTRVLVIPTDEERVIARALRAVIG